MAEAAAVPRELVDRERLAALLVERLGPDYGEFEVSRLGEGQSCLTFLLSGAGWSLVLRRPPRGDLPPSAFDVGREYRVMSALRAAGAEVPVPRPLLFEEGGETIGARFYVMEPVAGIVVRDEPPPELDAAARRLLSLDLVDVLGRLHGVDLGAAGLADFGNPGAYAERQLGRMSKLWERARFRELPAVEELCAWLAANLPEAAAPTLVHGDYKLDNAIVDPPSGAVAAVVDWELSTLGDPLADLGWLAYYWMDEAAEREWPRMPAAMLGDGFASRAEMVGRYRELRPAPESALRWYAALAGWKCAVMLEGSYRRFVEGVSDIPTHAALEEGVPFLARRGLAFARGELEV